MNDTNVVDAIRSFTQEGFSQAVDGSNDGVGTITWDNPSASGLPTYAQIKTKATELSADNAKNALRETRDMMISTSDWMGNSDVTITDAWKTYRQALRDITETITDDSVRQAMADDWNHSSWPTKPS
tara:strand:+ start:63 stop:443 length:381 start_codon:yes stop_codon:yes gene_type:complete